MVFRNQVAKYESAYDHQTWHEGNLPWRAIIYKVK